MTDHPLTPHLTDAEFTDLLLGSISPSVTAHLEHCSACANEARSVSNSILSFEQGSRAWAERRATGKPVLVAPVPRGAWIGVPGLGMGWQALAALALLCAGAGLSYQVEHRAQTPAASAVSSAHSSGSPVSPATLKADNELLSAIDGELQAEVAPPASVYGLVVSEHPSHSHRANRMMN